MGSYNPNNQLTLVMVGKTGNGKSATGNSILRKKAFHSTSDADGVTTICNMQQSDPEYGQIVRVIDTPGLFDFSANKNEEYGKEIMRCMEMVKDGIHAVLVVLTVRSRYTPEEEAVLVSLRNFFGDKINEYMIVLFTGGDELDYENKTLDEYLERNCPEPLKEMLEMCGNRKILFDNRTIDELKISEQLSTLFSLVGKVGDSNGGVPFTNALFLSMQETAKLRQLVKAHEEQINDITIKYKENMRELSERLEEEKAARLKAEAQAHAAHEAYEADKKSTEKMMDRLEDARVSRVKIEEQVHSAHEAQMKETEKNMTQLKEEKDQLEEDKARLEKQRAGEYLPDALCAIPILGSIVSPVRMIVRAMQKR